MALNTKNVPLHIHKLSLLNNPNDNKANIHSKIYTELSRITMKGLSAKARMKIKLIPQLQLLSAQKSVKTNLYTQSIPSPKKQLCWSSRNHPTSSLLSPYAYTHTQTQSSFLNKNAKYESLTKREKRLSDKKQKIKGKMIKLMQNSLIIDQEIANRMKLDYNYEKSIESSKIKMKNQKRTVFIVNTKGSSNEFTQMNPQYRFEDCYFTPNEFIQKNFDKEEIKTITCDPKYFLLDKPPFKGNEMNIQLTLIDKINQEDECKINETISQKYIKLNTINDDNSNINQRSHTAFNRCLHENLHYNTKINRKQYSHHGTVNNSYHHHKEHHNQIRYAHLFNQDKLNQQNDNNNKTKKRLLTSNLYEKSLIHKKPINQSFESIIFKQRMQWFNHKKTKNQQKHIKDIEDWHYIRKIVSILKQNYAA